MGNLGGQNFTARTAPYVLVEINISSSTGGGADV